MHVSAWVCVCARHMCTALRVLVSEGGKHYQRKSNGEKYVCVSLCTMYHYLFLFYICIFFVSCSVLSLFILAHMHNRDICIVQNAIFFAFAKSPASLWS